MSHILHRSLRKDLPTAAQGDGVYVIDTTGKRYLDASGGAAVSCLGHSENRVADAVAAQLGKVAFVHSSFLTNAPAEDLATRLVTAAPAGFGNGRVIFVGSGSEAMEVALKLARQYWLERNQPERTVFISRELSYHGNTIGALSVGGHAARRAPYAAMLMEAAFIPRHQPYHGRASDESEEAYGLRMAAHLETAMLEQGPGRVAAFIVEPVSGAGLGSVPPVQGYLKELRRICDKYDVLMICDEVMCGMGRTGSLFACAPEGITPDIITVAKGLAAGYQPLAAVLARETLVRALYDGSGALANGHTYMSHPAACAAGLAVLDIIESDGLLDNVRARGAELYQKLVAAFGDHPNVGDIRGRGLFWSLELVAERNSRAPLDPALKVADRLKAAAMAEGLICYPSAGTQDGAVGDHVLLAPPYIVTSAQIDEIIAKLQAAMAQVLV